MMKDRNFEVNLIQSCILVLTLMLCTPAHAVDNANSMKASKYIKEYTRDGIRVVVDAEPVTLSIVDSVNISIEVHSDASIKSELIVPERLKDSFEILQQPLERNAQNHSVKQQVSASGTDDSNVKKVISLRLLPIVTGDLSIDGLAVNYWSEDDAQMKTAIDFDPINISVCSMLSSEDKNLIAEEGGLKSFVDNQIADSILADQLLSIPDYKRISALVIICVAIIAGALSFVIWKRYKSRQPIHIYKLAHEIALGLLEKLQTRDLNKRGCTKLYYEKICQILRYYIEYRFSINAPEMTTEEFFDLLRDNDLLDQDHKANLREFFDICDMVKFAKFDPPFDKVEHSYSLVKLFIECTADEQCVIDVADNRDLKMLEAEDAAV